MKPLWAFVALAAILVNCGKSKTPASADETGIASWYGPHFQGRLCANGEIFDTEKLTAAHRTLPFGTVLLVTRPSNGKVVEVRINDRGPFVAGRIIDLSHAAAEIIEMSSIAPVELRIKSKPVTRDLDVYGVQVDIVENRDAADRIRSSLQTRFGTAEVVLRDGDRPAWRILTGREDSEAGAEQLAGTLRSEFPSTFVVRLDPSP